MVARFRSWWQKIHKPLLVVGAFVAFLLLLALLTMIVMVYVFNVNVPGLSGKTLWDWLQLLIIPLGLAVVALLFNLATTQKDENIALDKQREDLLQIYLDRMSELLLKEHLGELTPEGKPNPKYKKLVYQQEVRNLARTRTKVALIRLDSHRKGIVLKFLYESHFIEKDPRIVDISRAELDGAYLRLFNLSEANLSGANLSGTNLSGANLSGADLCCSTSNEGTRPTQLVRAILTGADLRNAHLRNADLRNANLERAKLSDADLSGANLQGANLSEADLRNANLQGAYYNTKRVPWKDAHGNPLTLKPTQWPQNFNLEVEKTICANWALQYSSEDCHLIREPIQKTEGNQVTQRRNHA
jgi:Pentapeptide repeats (8 copies)